MTPDQWIHLAGILTTAAVAIVALVLKKTAPANAGADVMKLVTDAFATAHGATLDKLVALPTDIARVVADVAQLKPAAAPTAVLPPEHPLNAPATVAALTALPGVVANLAQALASKEGGK